MKKIILTFSIVGSFIFSSCGDSRFSGFEKTETGIYYKIYKEGDKSQVIKEGDYVFFSQIITNENDSVINDSRKIPDNQKPLVARIAKSSYPGDIFESFRMMHPGDCTSFYLRVDDFFNKTNKQPVPSFLDSTSYLKFSIKIDSFYTEERVKKIEKEIQAKNEIKLKMYESIEDSLLNSYLTTNKITVKPTKSGLYFIEKQKGSGPLIKAGDEVSVEYTGMLTNGKIFDSSTTHNEAFTFTAGAKQVIEGWDEALLKMRKGSKALIVCPSVIAYGRNGSQGVIPPYAPLVFEMEVVGIKSAK
jgi:FKBP-type peptidyl-prolyl cis-trans isomerase